MNLKVVVERTSRRIDDNAIASRVAHLNEEGMSIDKLWRIVLRRRVAMETYADSVDRRLVPHHNERQWNALYYLI